jgi:hypothetical protein
LHPPPFAGRLGGGDERCAELLAEGEDVFDAVPVAGERLGPVTAAHRAVQLLMRLEQRRGHRQRIIQILQRRGWELRPARPTLPVPFPPSPVTCPSPPKTVEWLGNTGYQRVLLSPGIEVHFHPVTIYADAEFPVYQNFTGNQLAAPVLFKASVSFMF